MASDGRSDWKKWTGRALVLVGLVWLAFIFVKYNPGPYVGFREALFDCTPLAVIVAGGGDGRESTVEGKCCSVGN